jgi:hypothetical protein
LKVLTNPPIVAGCDDATRIDRRLSGGQPPERDRGLPDDEGDWDSDDWQMTVLDRFGP